MLFHFVVYFLLSEDVTLMFKDVPINQKMFIDNKIPFENKKGQAVVYTYACPLLVFTYFSFNFNHNCTHWNI